ncbi:MAG: tRNA lysidine(34) synthetase TilS [Candidatus Saccharimonadales bacterium]
MDITKTIRLEPGHYIVAVSGGVDSIALLDMLAKLYPRKGSDVHFTVAHFDHGIRDASHIDRQLVHEEAVRHKLPFVFEEGSLGPEASEAAAREARYAFLRKVQQHADARGIVTAHHLDDVVETAILNLMRGTGRKGLTSLKSQDGIIRPVAHVPKSRLRAYAEANGLTWHEDSTNTNQDYKRNYVRHTIVPKAKAKSKTDYHKLVALLKRQRDLNQAIDTQLETILHMQPSRKVLRRMDVAILPYAVAAELVAEWLRANGKRQLSRWLVDRLTVSIRTARPNTELLLDSTSKVAFSKTKAEFKTV